MSLTLKAHLKRQTLLLVGIAYFTSLLILIASSIIQTHRSQEAALVGLAATTGAQINYILPSFLLPEEKAGQSLLLTKFREEEGLSDAVILEGDAHGLPSEWKKSCDSIDGMMFCNRFFPSQVAIIVPINHDDKQFGRLLKVKDVDGGLLAKAFIPSAIILAFALLLSLLGLVWGVARLTTKEIPTAAELLLDAVRCCLVGESPAKQTHFRFEEFRKLSEAIDSLIRATQDGRRNAAIAQTTQMLAHDIRMPFSIFQIGLGMLGKAKDLESVKSILARLVPEIDKAVGSVEGLIADIMEVGSTSTQFIQEALSPEYLIQSCLDQIFRIYPKSDISIDYDLRHTYMVKVHGLKVGRVFANIVGNAIQAIGTKGTIWFKTVDQDGFVEFSLGNTNSFVTPESIPKLFEAVFTSGKAGGNGLGLAIAQKVVHAHGGKIWCESARTLEHPNGYVEFKFTLPIADGKLKIVPSSLPSHSDDFRKGMQVALLEPSKEKSVNRANRHTEMLLDH